MCQLYQIRTKDQKQWVFNWTSFTSARLSIETAIEDLNPLEKEQTNFVHGDESLLLELFWLFRTIKSLW